MGDEFSNRYGDLLAGGYDCVDRIVLNAYFPMGHQPGGFRVWWWRLHDDSDAQLDNTHLMRMAGRFARRVKAWGQANEVPVIFCKKGERKHRIAEQYLANHSGGSGVFLVLVAKARAPVWKAKRSEAGVLVNLEKKYEYVYHYSFHILDRHWGHVTIKISGHPPFGAQIMLNGHEYVGAHARAAGLEFGKEGNCFTRIVDPAALAQVADTLSQPATIGRLSQVCDQWIYTACLCFGLGLDQQARSGFRYGYSVYQVEYSRNLLFRDGARMDAVFNTVLDRTRSRLDVPTLRTLFGAKARPHRDRTAGPPQLAAVIETPGYDLTLFKVHFGNLTLKAYTKGERVLRFEAIVHNTAELRCGRVLDRFPEIVTRLAGMTDRFTTLLDCVDIGFVPDHTLDALPASSQLGATRVGGVDLNKPRMRHAAAAVLTLAPAQGFTVGQFTAKVHALTGQTSAEYSVRQAAYDLRKLRGKQLIAKPSRARSYYVEPAAARTLSALLTLRDHVIAPIVAGVRSPRPGRKPAVWTPVDRDYEQIRISMQTLFSHLGITAGAAAA
jgi:hypothetical protein